MVLLAASVCTRGGKPVISRQFREMPRSRVEALLASFPKLLTSGSQHTTIETDSVRYVYQPLEDLYMILITNKSSNILQDIDSLHLFSRLVSDLCKNLDEREISRNAFQLLGAFDEIAAMGYRENVNLQQIRSILEMESHEEKIQEIIERNKEMEAKEELKRRAKQLEMQRRDAARMGGVPRGNHGGFGTVGVSTNAGYSSVPVTGLDGVRDTGVEESSLPSSKPFKSKGMQLGKKSKNAELLGAMSIPDTSASEEASLAASQQQAEAAAPAVSRAPAAAPAVAFDPLDYLPSVQQESVHLLVKEKVSMTGARDGGASALDISGILELRVSDPNQSKLRIQLSPISSKSILNSGEATYKTHPHVDKNLWNSSRSIGLKDSKKPFPINQTLPVLRWRFSSKDETFLPLIINCWPSVSGDDVGSAELNLDFELENKDLVLKNVRIEIPLPDTLENQPELPPVGENPEENPGDWYYDENSNSVVWEIQEVSEGLNPSGNLEFKVPNGATSNDVFYPVKIDFVSQQTLCMVEVADVTQVDSNSSTVFSQQTVLSTENYVIA